MRIVARTSDLVRLSLLRVLPTDAGIKSSLRDAHFRAVEGGIGAFPRRLAVAAQDERRVRALFFDAQEETA